MRMTEKRKIVKIGTIGLAFCIFGLMLFLASVNSNEAERNYGVFLGIDKSEISKLSDYRVVVIEPSTFSQGDINQLHKEGKFVYGYLNIGSVEEFRSYFERFQNLILGEYENWPDEWWINVTSADWQTFVVQNLGKQYADMGIDGFFLDNTDVYYQYPTEDTFQGLCFILRGLRGYQLKVLINGGDSFVSRCMDENMATELFDGINQEGVFTRIDFDHKTYHRQEEEETKRYKEYLSRAKKSGLEIYLLEYGADTSTQKMIDKYCELNGMRWYNAESLELHVYR